MVDVTERERFDFEREKWRADLDMRSREIALKEGEQASSKWRSPITVAILAAAAAAVGNAVVAIINGTQQVSVENSKAESARILEMIKTGNPEAAAGNLDFLLKSGLIADSDRAAKLAVFLKDRKPGTGPSLPPASQFRFEATEALTPSIQNELDKRLDAFVSYVNKLGFPPDKNKPSIKIDKLAAPAAWYHPDGNRIVIDAKLVGDPSVVLHEYVHRVLLTRGELPRWIPEREFARIESGVADYFVGSFLGVARIGEEASKVPEMSSSWMRVLEKELKFENRGFVKDQFRSLHDGAEVWGSALWALRTTLGSEVLDPIVATAWLAAKWPLDDDKEMPLAFTTALITTVKQKASGQADEVKAILQRRGFPVPR